MTYTTLELFEMYKEAMSQAGYCRSRRIRGSFGIVVEKDRDARHYQKWAALALRLDEAITERLTAGNGAK